MKNTLSNWFRYFSIKTWNRIELSKKTKRIKASETTLTENLVYEFFELTAQFDLPIQIYETTNERVLGNDLEFAIETKSGYVLFPTQAKKIRDNGKYNFISHIVRGIFQIDLLEKYAHQINGIPLYLFYNYFDGWQFHNEMDSIKKNIDHDISCYGCSFSLSETIQKFRTGNKWKIPSFWDIHPNDGIPMFQILNILGDNLESCSLFQVKNVIRKYSPKYLTKKEVTDHIDWMNLAPHPSIGYIPSNESLEKEKKNIFSALTPSYNPRFRIVISNNPNSNKSRMGVLGYSS